MEKSQALEEARRCLGRVIGKRWRLERVLGAGPLGAVFAANHRNGRQGAIRILLGPMAREPKFCELLSRQAFIANQIAHPNVLPVVDDGEDEVGPFLVMDLLDGMSLADKLEATKVLPVQEVLTLGAEVLSALVAVHQQGFVHRDIKPANIFVCRDGTIRLLDFGTALTAQDKSDPFAALGLTVGTPEYLAPELAGATENVDGRSDLFSLAACMFKALSGRPIRSAASPRQMLQLAATTPIVSLMSVAPSVPENVVALIDRALSFDRDKRPRSAERLLASFDALNPRAKRVVTHERTPPSTPKAEGNDTLEEMRRASKRFFSKPGRASPPPASGPPEQAAPERPSRPQSLPSDVHVAPQPMPMASPSFEAPIPPKVAALGLPSFEDVVDPRPAPTNAAQTAPLAGTQYETLRPSEFQALATQSSVPPPPPRQRPPLKKPATARPAVVASTMMEVGEPLRASSSEPSTSSSPHAHESTSPAAPAPIAEKPNPRQLLGGTIDTDPSQEQHLRSWLAVSARKDAAPIEKGKPASRQLTLQLVAQRLQRLSAEAWALASDRYHRSQRLQALVRRMQRLPPYVWGLIAGACFAVIVWVIVFTVVMTSAPPGGTMP